MFRKEYLIMCFYILSSLYIIFDVQLPLFREGFAFLYVAVFPGTLLLILFGFYVDDLIDLFLYQVGFSLSSWLLIMGLVLFSPVKTPLSSWTLRFICVLYVSLLFGLCIYRFGLSGWPMPSSDLNLAGDTVNKSEKLILSYLTLSAAVLVFSVEVLYDIIGSVDALSVPVIFLAISPILLFKLNIRRKWMVVSLILISVQVVSLRSLLSAYITGFDVYHNYYWSALAIATQTPIINTANNYASTLPPQTLIPLYHSVLDLSLNTIFKIVIPIIFAVIVPLCLFRVYEEIYSQNQIVFGSILLIIFNLSFFYKMPILAKQMIAEIFLGLALFSAMQYQESGRTIHSAGLILFSISMVFSHYSTTLVVIILSMPLLLLSLTDIKYIGRKSIGIFPKSVIILVSILFIAWYSRAGNSFMFNKIVITIYTSLVQQSQSSAGQISSSVSTGIGSTALIVFTAAILLLVGFGTSIILFTYAIGECESRDYKFAKRYISYINTWDRSGPSHSEASLVIYSTTALAGMGFFVAASTIFSLQRYYHFLLIFGAPFAIIGLQYLLNPLQKISRSINTTQVISVLLVLTLILNSGIVTQYSNEEPRLIFGVNQIQVTENDVASSTFLMQHTDSQNALIQSSIYAFPKFYSGYFRTSPVEYRVDTYTLSGLSYSPSKRIDGYFIVYSQAHTTGKMRVFGPSKERYRTKVASLDTIKITLGEQKSQKIYSAGKSYIYI